MLEDHHLEATPRIKLSSAEFLELWETEDQAQLDKAGIKLEKTFEDELVWLFENIQVEEDIVVPEGKSLGNLIISANSKIGNFAIGKDGTSGDILLAGTSGHIWVDGTSGDIWVEGTSDEIWVDGTSGDIWVEGTSGEIRVDGTSGQIWVDGTSGDIWVDGTSGQIWVDGTSDDIWVNHNSKPGKIILSGSITSFTAKTQLSQILIENAHIKNKIILENAQVEKVTIERNHFEPIHIFIQSCEIAHFHIRQSSFGEQDQLRINSAQIYELKLDSLTNKGNIFLSDIKPLHTWTYYEEQKGKMEGKKVKHENTKIDIQESDLGNTQIINCDLNKFSEFIYMNSKILDIFMARSNFPNPDKFKIPVTDHNQDSKTKFEQQRLAYGQLKYAYQKQGGQTQASLYRGYELDAYRSQLRIDYKNEKDKRQNNQKSLNLWDIRKEQIVLFLNRYSSNYGNNWMRAAIGTLLLSAGCFMIYCILIGYRIGPDMKKFFELSSHFLQYLNPFRDEDTGQLIELIKNDGLEITPLSRFWDYLSRIIIAFMVYQTIAAFRRLGKSSV